MPTRFGSLDNTREAPQIAVYDVVERKPSLQHLVKVEAIHSDARVAASALAQPNNGVRNPHALTLIPDHPKGAGQPGAIVNRRNSELILEQPAEMRRTAEAV